jgi:tRNA-2-methylthio-N6-dimethylallyladenosine synthase
MGRTECNRIVNFKGHPRLMNELIDLTITDAFPHSLRAEVPVLAETPA